jgi:prepilin-type N-terminal cleavage/methylation domain-containing protein
MGQRAAALAAPGFTLLELVVTLMVLALALAVAGPTIGRTTDTIRTRAEVARFSAFLRHAREQAITTQRPHELSVDPAARRVTLRAGEEIRQIRSLPEHLPVQAEPAVALTVRFEPHGTTSGGAFRVASGTTRYRVTVDPLTGRVRAARE